MGYLLKEALKTLCGVNQWAYAVFWKIGYQNPNLLIWEDCYYEPASCSYSYVEAVDKVDSLVNKMMMGSHVIIIGQGLVGRVAFSGNHEWIISNNYFKETLPPEVVKEACQQFSAGMQTVAVIPVLPHGVVQFGSYKTIAENVEFISDVTLLVSQLGCVPDVLLSENYESSEPARRMGVPLFRGNSSYGQFSLDSTMINTINTSNFQIPVFDSQTSYSIPSEFQAFQESNSFSNLPKAEVIPSNPEIWMNQHASPYIQRSNLDLSSTSSATLIPNSTHIKNMNLPNMEDSISELLMRNSLLAATKIHQMGQRFSQGDLSSCKEELEEHRSFKPHNNNNNTPFMAELSQTQSGDDLFDILGAEFKNNFFTNCSSSSLRNETTSNAQNWDMDNFPSRNNLPSMGIYYENSKSGTDHLLDAVISKVQCPDKLSLDDNISCRTTITNTSSSLPYGRFGVSEQMKGELFGIPKFKAKAAVMSSCSSMENSYSHGSSFYGSQLSSWTEKGQSSKQKSVSTGCSKKPEETGKTNRKRCKPGENPRPRPKDRQMIQDRVRELREIVPNGAKCSIDALLERTIKHMLFLQSVTKHADKLKQTGESKIINQEGSLTLKDNFGGGATWAYEVGSQSAVCPIIVEDLNQPRQMLIEMLCEERGLFLEIADIIRGLGLTILKGVMETRNDKIWARFTVEANRDVTRMEIFISLVRLLEQTTKTGASQPNENMMVQQLHRATSSVPMTGRQ